MGCPVRVSKGEIGVATAALLLSMGGCGSGSDTEDSAGEPAETSPSKVSEPYSGYPDSIAVLGHSQATGENTEPYAAGDTKSNTWATGTNPAVNSVYIRGLEQNPDLEGRAYNYAEPSATIEMINTQASLAAAKSPDLVMIQTIDADIVCPATDADYERFGDGVAAVLDTLKKGSPSTRVFIVSQYGSPETYFESLTGQQRRELGSMMGGPGPCAFVDSQGKLVREEVDRLENIIRAYEQQIAEVCEAEDNCEHDHGAFSEAVDKPGDYTDDLNHLSIQGHSRAAELAWEAMTVVDLLPAP